MSLLLGDVANDSFTESVGLEPDTMPMVVKGIECRCYMEREVRDSFVILHDVSRLQLW